MVLVCRVLGESQGQGAREGVDFGLHQTLLVLRKDSVVP